MNHLRRQPIRVRHQPKRRQLEVVSVEPISPRMRRIVLAATTSQTSRAPPPTTTSS